MPSSAAHKITSINMNHGQDTNPNPHTENILAPGSIECRINISLRKTAQSRTHTQFECHLCFRPPHSPLPNSGTQIGPIYCGDRPAGGLLRTHQVYGPRASIVGTPFGVVTLGELVPTFGRFQVTSAIYCDFFQSLTM